LFALEDYASGKIFTWLMSDVGYHDSNGNHQFIRETPIPKRSAAG
jgi:hypothetical protein